MFRASLFIRGTKMETAQYVNQETNCDISEPWNTTQQ